MSEPKKTLVEGLKVEEGLKEGIPYRSECDCPCHTPEGREVGMMHFTACCEPDPPPRNIRYIWHATNDSRTGSTGRIYDDPLMQQAYDEGFEHGQEPAQPPQELVSLREALQSVIDERDTELDMMHCPYTNGTREHDAWHQGVREAWERFDVVKRKARAALTRGAEAAIRAETPPATDHFPDIGKEMGKHEELKSNMKNARAETPAPREPKLTISDLDEILAGYDSAHVTRGTVLQRLNEWLRIRAAGEPEQAK